MCTTIESLSSSEKFFVFTTNSYPSNMTVFLACPLPFKTIFSCWPLKQQVMFWTWERYYFLGQPSSANLKSYELNRLQGTSRNICGKGSSCSLWNWPRLLYSSFVWPLRLCPRIGKVHADTRGWVWGRPTGGRWLPRCIVFGRFGWRIWVMN